MKNQTAKIKHKCLACGSELSEPLFKISNMPCGAQAMPTEEELDKDKGIDLELCGCPVCGLVQFDCEPVEYYRDAIRVVGLSETMKQLRRDDYSYLTEHYGMGGRKWLECGCSNGDFLKVLTEFDVDIYGTEWGNDGLKDTYDKLCASGNEGRAAVDPSHIMHFFPDSADMDIPGAPFDVFLSFNFLEHQPDPVSMLKCLRRNLKDDGIGLITVPSFEYIINEGRYYELVRDHIANYDMDSLTNLCRLCGFEVLEKGFIGIGDTLRVIVRKASEIGAAGAEIPEAERLKIKMLREGAGKDTAERHFQKIKVLKDDYERMNSEISGYLGDLKRKGRSFALWGAGHQGFTIASTTEIRNQARFIIDSSDKKQGKYAPASHLKIVPPETYTEDPVDVIIISAPGYVREIERSIRERYGNTRVGVPAICSILDLTEK